MDLLQHTAGELNISDLGTRGIARMSDIQSGSLWQSGPAYLKDNRSSWPVTREFVKVIPPEEKKSKLYKLVMSIKAADIKDMASVYSIVYRVSSWTTARGSMARFLNAHLNGKTRTA